MRQVNLETFLRQVRKTKVDSCHLRKVVDKQIRYTIHANIIPLLQINCGTCHCKVPVYSMIVNEKKRLINACIFGKKC